MKRLKNFRNVLGFELKFLASKIVGTGLEALIVGSEADIHITALNGRSPLVSAAACGQLACIELLLTHGAEAGGNDGCLALVAAARKGRNKCVEALLLSGAEVDALEDRKCSPKGECVAARGSSHPSSYQRVADQFDNRLSD